MPAEKPVPITQQGLRKVQSELESLRTRRTELAQRIKAALEDGDLSENAGYDDAKNEQGFVEGRILELESITRNAQIVEAVRNDGRVGIGSTVRIRANGMEEQYTIVGPAEVDASHGRISHESPIGKALMGHQAGEEISILTPAGARTFQIIGVQ
jgi:transcription elongation factor GreA